MKIEEILEKMNYLSVEQVENPKLEIEDMIHLSPTLTGDNILTYILFLQIRKDLPDDEREAIEQLIKAMREDEKRQYAEAFGQISAREKLYS